MDRRLMLSPESAEASEIFDKFCNANTLKGIIYHYRQLCRLLRIKATHFPDFYPRLKVRTSSLLLTGSTETQTTTFNWNVFFYVSPQTKLCSWRAQGLWTKIEKRSSAKCYARGNACASSRVGSHYQISKLV